MENKILIYNRSDSNANAPKIIIRSRNDTKKSGIIEEIRQNLLKRIPKFKIEITTQEANGYVSDTMHLPMYLINRACSFKTPFVNNDFDYLRRAVRETGCMMEITSRRIVLSYEISYLTTIFQEEQIDRRLREIFVENDLYNIREPIDRIKFIYGYIAKRVKYDHTYTKYSAYDALVSGSAVCEGCAALLYRMLSMAGVPCRIITGSGRAEPHAWNIVKVNGKWYNADVTWDLCETSVGSNFSRYAFFLKSEAHFPHHTRDADFLSHQFTVQHPMSTDDY